MAVGENIPIGWGLPAKIASSKDSFSCGLCGTKRGTYGKDFGRGPDSNPLPVIDSHAFDITITENRDIVALCWNCGFSF